MFISALTLDISCFCVELLSSELSLTGKHGHNSPIDTTGSLLVMEGGEATAREQKRANIDRMAGERYRLQIMPLSELPWS